MTCSTTVRKLTLLGAILLVASPAAAQDGAKTEPLGVEEARAIAYRFLTGAPQALRPKLKEPEFAKARVFLQDGALARPNTRGACFEFRMPHERNSPLRFMVAVSPTGQVVDSMCQDRAFDVPLRNAQGKTRTRADRKDEKDARTLFNERKLERRGRAFLARVIPRFKQRRYGVRRRTTTFRNDVEWQFSLQELPRRGSLAVYPNRIDVILNPETGEVIRFGSTCVDAEVREAPKVGAAKAKRLAAARHVGFKAKDAELSMIVKKNMARAVWIVELTLMKEYRMTLVDAETGAFVEPVETLD